MSAILTCTPEDAPLSVSFVTGESASCGTDATLEPTTCSLIQPLDLFYGSVAWTSGSYPWQSRDIFWDLGQTGGFVCQIEDWTTYTLNPADKWENIQDFWSSLGTY